MTYCIGILLDEGVVLASDSRTNAGIDRVSTFRKMFTFEKPGDRFFALLTAGNLSLTQGMDHDAHAASHAWAEAYFEDLGWVGFDPTNRACATEAYIRTAVGLDYAEAGPVRGVRSGGGVETMSVRVSFPNQLQQQSQ